MAMKIVRIAFCLSILLIVTSAAVTAHARTVSTDDEGGMSTGGMLDLRVLVGLIIESIVFSIVGLAILLVGYKIFDMVTPYHLNHEIAEQNNTAAGVAIAGIMIALGLIVSAAIGL
jgi:hypothetical protein